MDYGVMKDGVYFATLLVGLGISWAKTNADIKRNGREIDVLKELVEQKIDKEKSLFENQLNDISRNINAAFKKIDLLSGATNELEKTLLKHARKDDLKAHPTRDELKDKLDELHRDDSNLKEQIKELKQEVRDKLESLDKKFELIKESLEMHAKEETDKLHQIYQLLLENKK